jgi:hypothetical protein
MQVPRGASARRWACPRNTNQSRGSAMEPCYHIALHPCLKPGGASGCGCRNLPPAGPRNAPGPSCASRRRASRLPRRRSPLAVPARRQNHPACSSGIPSASGRRRRPVSEPEPGRGDRHQMDESDEFPVQEDSNYAIAILRIDEPLHPPDEIKGRVGLIVAEPGQVRSVAPDKRSMLGDIRQDKRVKSEPLPLRRHAIQVQATSRSTPAPASPH